MEDLRNVEKCGKWWFVGVVWVGYDFMFKEGLEKVNLKDVNKIKKSNKDLDSFEIKEDNIV